MFVRSMASIVMGIDKISETIVSEFRRILCRTNRIDFLNTKKRDAVRKRTMYLALFDY